MIHINLLPVKTSQKKERLKIQLYVAAAVVVAAIVLCALAWFQMSRWIDAAKEDVNRKRQEITRLDKMIEEVKLFEKRQADLRAKLDVLAKLEKNKSGPVLLLDEMCRSMPDQLWLTSLKETAGRVAVAGVSMNEETVALFMHNLEKSDQFANVVLKETQQIVSDGAKVYKFDIDCSLESQLKADAEKAKAQPATAPAAPVPAPKK